jgi:hypothetical protein
MKTNKKATKKGINQEVINTLPTPPTEGVNQEVIDNVQGPPTGNVPPAEPGDQLTVVEMMEFLMDAIQQLAGGALIGIKEDGTQLTIPVPKAKPKKLAEPMSASGGQVVGDFPRASTINPEDLLILLQKGMDKVIPFQVLSNAVASNDKLIASGHRIITSNIDWNDIRKSGIYNCQNANGPNRPNLTWGVLTVLNAGIYITQTIQEGDLRKQRMFSIESNAWSVWG